MSSKDDPDGLAKKELRGQIDAIDLTDDNASPAPQIDLTQSDDEDKDLKLAIALSLQDQQQTKIASSSKNATSSSPTSANPNPFRNERAQQAQPSSGSLNVKNLGLLGLDRKQMEAERLARLKRKREPGSEERPVTPPPLRQIAKASVTRDTSATARTEGSLGPSLQYPHGTVLLTSMDGNQKRSTSLAGLLKATEAEVPLKSALLSTFIVDFDWLLPHFDTRKVSFVLALHTRNGEHKTQLHQDFAGIPNVRLVFPHVGGLVNCMHSKIMLLFYEKASDKNGPTSLSSRCRIVISSANLVPWDYGVGAVMENIVFVIDLPALVQPSPAVNESGNGFKVNLVQMLQAMGTPEDVIRKLDTFDFAETAQYGFVHTLGGSHILSEIQNTPSVQGFMSGTDGRSRASESLSVAAIPLRTGSVGLSDTVQSLGLAVSPQDDSYPPKLDYVTSSLGNLKESFLTRLFLAACGRSSDLPTKAGTKALLDKAKLTKKPSLATGSGIGMDTVVPNLKIYFPSEHTVRNSKGGPGAAGTICFQSKWWDDAKSEIPQQSVHDCIGVRKDRILMHSKVC